MKIRKTIALLLGALLVGAAPLAAEEQNLIANPGFESYTHQPAAFIFPAYDEFTNWDKQGYSTNAETSDVYAGSVAVKLGANTSSAIYQQITGLTDADFEANAQFVLTLHYKVVSLSSGGSVSIDSYWEHATTFEGLKSHDADQLQRVLSDTAQDEWQTLVIETTRPANAKSFMLQLTAKSNCYVLFDEFSFVYREQDTPYITVTPDHVAPVSVLLGEEKDFQTIKIKQGHVTSATTFAITGANPELFTLSATSMPITESEMEIVVTYYPTSAGNHHAALIFDNVNHTTILPNSIALQGTCSNPSAQPVITVTPTAITDFQAILGEQQVKGIHIASFNCTSELKLKMEHIQGDAFTCLSSGIAKNYETDEPITFFPLEEGEYESRLIISSEGADTVFVTLKGKGEKRSESNIDWKTKFNWDLSSPLTYLNETFDTISRHNKTLIVEGWQNVAALEERPWWAFDEAKTEPARGENKYAKATAYQYGRSCTGIWESWLVTPALDYKNAEGKIFTFSVMCEYQPEEGSETKLEVFYIDANIGGGKDTVFFQNLTESFEIPKTDDENLAWRTFQLDLSPYENIADIFHIGFRYSGPNGADGVPTYYIDNVSWGRTDLAQLIVTPSYLIDSTAVVDQEVVIGELLIGGNNLTEDISLRVAGANYNRFSLSSATLPKEGGSVQVTFRGMDAGVHEAYVEISSKDAATKFVPMAVLCNAREGVQNTEYRTQTKKILRDGQVIIVRGGKEYTILGIENAKH